MTPDLSTLCVGPDSSIRQAIALIDRNQKGLVLVTDEERHLLGTITDGDVRRAMLERESLDVPVSILLARKVRSLHEKPVTAPVGSDCAVLLRLMQDRAVRQLPLLDGHGRVAGLVTLDELVPDLVLPVQAVIMAGGLGTRLRPLTDDLPKSMLPVGDKPLIERIVEQLRKAGIRRVNLTTHYKSNLISQHFGDGRDFGVEICYVEEGRPLGTAGALSLLDTSNDPLLVINGDILTQVDFRSILDFHIEQQAYMTVSVRQYEFRIPYGVVETDGIVVTGISEKPLVRHFINAGIYLLNPEVCKFVPDSQSYNMPDLISSLLTSGQRVVSFPIREYWLDIGQPADYEQALQDVVNIKFNQ